MELDKKSTKQLKKIYRQLYGRQLSPKELFQITQNLTGFFKLLVKFNQEDEMPKVKKYDCKRNREFFEKKGN